MSEAHKLSSKLSKLVNEDGADINDGVCYKVITDAIQRAEERGRVSVINEQEAIRKEVEA